jgi:hypothetical protein
MIVFILMVVMLFVPHGVTPFVGEDAIDATNQKDRSRGERGGTGVSLFPETKPVGGPG